MDNQASNGRMLQTLDEFLALLVLAGETARLGRPDTGDRRRRRAHVGPTLRRLQLPVPLLVARAGRGSPF